MHTPEGLRERAARARTIATEKTADGRAKNGSPYLIELAADLERQADLLERAGQKPKEAPPR